MPFRLAFLFIVCASLGHPVHAQDTGSFPPGWIHERPVPKPPQPISPMPNWYEVRGGEWQVPVKTLWHIASLLDARFVRNKYFNPAKPDHAIQFRGEIVDGVRIVRLLGNCSFGLDEPFRLSDAFLEIRDGGMCVFDAEYDPAQRRIRRFSYFPPYGPET